MKLIKVICFQIILFCCLATNAQDQQKIALFLPLRGAYGESAQAVRDGFLAAFYQSLSYDNSPPSVQIVDTGKADIVSLYQQAVSQKINLVVGPLDKQEAAQLIQSGSLQIPTLMLNTLPTSGDINTLYQLALSPEEEAKQVANKAFQDSKRSVLVIAPEGDWGRRVSDAFISQWTQLGGTLAGQTYYKEPAQLSSQISKLLHVEQSEQRAKSLRKILNQPKMRTIAYRRQDFDNVFLVAKPEFARQIRPLFNFYYAANIPVYATSHIYSGTPNPQLDQDLNGVIFCTTPWLIDKTRMPSIFQAAYRSVNYNFPEESKKQPQFFALGVDSYYLALQMLSGQIKKVNQGATGLLKLQSDRKWLRELVWAQMVKGKPKLIMNEKNNGSAS